MLKASCEEKIASVHLKKDKSGCLGLTISCGDTFETILQGAFIEAIMPGGPAACTGKLSPGDQIISVNGVNVQNENFLDVVDLIKGSESSVEIVVAKEDNIIQQKNKLTDNLIEPLCRKIETWLSDEVNGNVESSDTKQCEDPPFKLESPEKMDCQIITEHVKHMDKSIPDIIPPQMKNDIRRNCSSNIVSDKSDINGGCNLNKDTCVGNQYNGLTSDIPEVGNPILGQKYKVTIDKNGGSLGLNIYEGTELLSSKRCIYVHSIISGGAAEGNKKIKPGDKLLEVNGMDLENLSYQEVITMLRKSSSVVHLALERGPSTLFGYSGDDYIPECVNLLKQIEMDAVLKERHVDPDDVPLLDNLKKEMQSLVGNKMDLAPYDNYADSFEKDLKLCSNQGRSGEDSLKSGDFLANGQHMHDVPSVHDNHCTDDSYNTFINASSSSCTSSLSSHNCDTDVSNTAISCAKDLSSSRSLQSTGLFHDDLKPVVVPVLTDSSLHNSDHKEKTSPHNSVIQQNSSTDPKDVQKVLTYHRSTPNLIQSDENTYRGENRLCRNKSSDCLPSCLPYVEIDVTDASHNMNYNTGCGTNNAEVPKAPLRKKKFKKLEDIHQFLTADNNFSVTILRSSRGIGLSISGGANETTNMFSQLIRIRKLYPLQPAMESGKLCVGDIILDVNGISMLGKTNTEALEILRCCGVEVTLKIFRPNKQNFPFLSYKDMWAAADSPPSSSSSSTLSVVSSSSTLSYGSRDGADSKEFKITLMKRGGSLGFTLQRLDENTADDGSGGIYIKALTKEPALSDGRLHPGDKIIQVNDVNVSSMSHAEAVSFLRSAPDVVVLTLQRSDPPASPLDMDITQQLPKPLRWEAKELLSDRMKQKNISESPGDKKKLRRNIKSPERSVESTESTRTSPKQRKQLPVPLHGNNISCSHKEHEIDELAQPLDFPNELDAPGLQRCQRPKSLDMLNSSQRKQLTEDEDSFHRQASVIGSTLDQKKILDLSDISGEKKGIKTLMKWRGSNLPTENSSTSVVDTSKPYADDHNEDNESKSCEYEDVPSSPCELTVCNPEQPWVRTLDIALDRGWHGRLGFSICDPPAEVENLPTNLLPRAPEVKVVYEGSLASKDGRIKVGDRLVEANSESFLAKPAVEAIGILRKTKGLIKMVFCRLENYNWQNSE